MDKLWKLIITLFKVSAISIIILIVLSVLGLLFYKYAYYPYLSLNSSEKHFYRELNKKLKNGETEIYIKNLTDFEWDQVCFLGSYSFIPLKEDFSKKIKGYARKGSYPNLNNDGVWALEFIIHAKKTIVIVKGRKISYDYNNLKGGCFSSESKLIIKNNMFIIKEK